MKIKSVFFTIAFSLMLFAFQNSVNGQALGHTYKTGIGVKLGYWDGAALDIKHFVKPSAALEGQLGFGHHWFSITGLYEYHGPIQGAPGLTWYAGPGAHVGFWDNHYRNRNDHHDRAFFGVDGVLGLDYKFNRAPIDISLDIQPRLTIPGGDFDVWGGLGIRFAF